MVISILEMKKQSTKWPEMLVEEMNNHAIWCLHASCIYCSNCHFHLPNLYLFFQIQHKNKLFCKTFLNLPEEITYNY